jgi:mycothiol synthase
MSSALENDRAAPGGPQAWLGTIGVRREYRESGVASALMTRTMEAFRQRGYRKAILDVDTENPTGALGLYERHGFRSIHRYILRGKTVREGVGASQAGIGATG